MPHDCLGCSPGHRLRPGTTPQPAPTPSRRCSPARPPEPRGCLARLSALACPVCVPHPVAGASCENQIWPCLLLPHTRPRPCGTPHPSWATDQACRSPHRPTGPRFPLHTLPRSSLTLNSPSGLPAQGWDMVSPRPETPVSFLISVLRELQHRHFLRRPFLPVFSCQAQPVP